MIVINLYFLEFIIFIQSTSHLMWYKYTHLHNTIVNSNHPSFGDIVLIIGIMKIEKTIDTKLNSFLLFLFWSHFSRIPVSQSSHASLVLILLTQKGWKTEWTVPSLESNFQPAAPQFDALTTAPLGFFYPDFSVAKII